MASDTGDQDIEQLDADLQTMLALVRSGRLLQPADRINELLDLFIRPVERTMFIWLAAEEETSGVAVVFIAGLLKGHLDDVSKRLEAIQRRYTEPPRHER